MFEASLLACGIVALLSAPPADAGRAHEPVIRVGIAVNAAAATLSCDGEVRVWRVGSGLAGSVFGPGCAFRLQPSVPEPAPPPGARRLLVLDGVSGQTLGAFEEELIFEPLIPDAPLEVDGKACRGEIVAHAARSGGLTVVNALGIEAYLCGVLPLEMGAGEATPPAALEAQAIAARSYTLYYLGRRAEHRCDLFATTEDQVYGGIPAETPAGTRAVLGTRGVVATYRGNPIRANYSSTCGGVTETSDEAWDGERFPYLRRVKDDDGSGGALCAGSRYFRWRVSWDPRQLEASILTRLPEEVPEARGIDLGRLKDLRVAARTSSGRVRVLEVRTQHGTFRVSGDRARRLVRTPAGAPLYSAFWGRFRRTAQDDGRIELEGRGYGHGVGMCQCGALEMGRRGAGAGEILKHYYGGVALARWW